MESVINAVNEYNKSYMDNLYEILGCDMNSSFEQITTEYKIKAKKFHPDKNLALEKDSEFFKINEAYTILSDPKSRENYDAWKSSNNFHWISSKDPILKIAETDQFSIDQTKKLNSANSTTTFRSSVEQETDDLYAKFRNYEI
ncbi:hypothetical protein BB560_001352 [Smittium megazygosporum]|uniref:J domain-containing protein n=1 Tax=Smittium megazygosporum TaxID=133381 RepID=A0A2T9ZHS0_9FUNG|nr:hypothetical protein BB560_001352 [Smittium megazygosporum]